VTLFPLILFFPSFLPAYAVASLGVITWLARSPAYLLARSRSEQTEPFSPSSSLHTRPYHRHSSPHQRRHSLPPHSLVLSPARLSFSFALLFIYLDTMTIIDPRYSPGPSSLSLPTPCSFLLSPPSFTDISSSSPIERRCAPSASSISRSEATPFAISTLSSSSACTPSSQCASPTSNAKNPGERRRRWRGGNSAKGRCWSEGQGS
jgi:hypothetical protein